MGGDDRGEDQKLLVIFLRVVCGRGRNRRS